MTTFQQYQAFERALTKNQLNDGRSRKYLGYARDLKKYILPPMKTSKMNLQKTEKTWRACRSCMASRYKAKKHITGQITLEKCLICKGEGKVFG